MTVLDKKIRRRTKKVVFKSGDSASAASAASGVELAAVLNQPAGEPRATALFAHCFTCTKDLRSARILSHGLVDRGFAVLRFDFTGLGESGGEFAASTFSTNIDDLVAAADYLRKEHQAPSLLVGHSLGGAAVILAASRISEVKAVATLGAPSDLQHLREGVLREVDPQREISQVSIGGRPFTVGGELVRDLDKHRLLEALNALRKPLLIMHSPIDDIVSIDHARELYKAARHPKSFVSLDGADHLLLKDPKDAVFVAEVLSSWATRYVAEAEVAKAEVAEAEVAEAEVAETEVAQETGDTSEAGGAVTAVEADSESGCGSAPGKAPPVPLDVVQVEGGEDLYTNTVTTHRHQLTADEPEDVGGADLGPSPYEMLLGGLGSCISMTLRMYADRKGIPLKSVRVRLRHSRQHAKDCSDCESITGAIDIIEKEIELRGPELSEEQRQRLIEISGRCPVHKTLTTETKVRLVDRLE